MITQAFDTTPILLIRYIARQIVGQAVSDFDITRDASKSGCHCRVTPDLNTLEPQEHKALIEFKVAEGQSVGMPIRFVEQAA